MANDYLGEGKLLQYNPVYGVLICRDCEYGIQKSAIDSHLLKHKIYRGDRQELLALVAKLNILEPDDVPQPYSGDQPIEGLPVLSGYRCKEEACEHLTISEKRIRRHWSDAHGQGESLPHLSDFTCRVHLQTFFRGTKLRYFEVAPVTPHDAVRDKPSSEEPPENDRRLSSNQDHDTAFAATDGNLEPLISATATLDLTIMNYFHHFLTITCHTLPGPDIYWQGHIIPIGLRHEWLLYGLLSIAARHMAALAAGSPQAVQYHMQHVDTFTTRFGAGLAEGISSRLITSEFGGDIIETALRVRSLLRLSQVADAIRSLDDTSHSVDLVILIKDCCTTSFQAGNSPASAIDTPNLTLDNIPPAVFNHIDTLSARMAPILGKPDSATDPFATVAANVLLVNGCSISFAQDTPKGAWSGMEHWLVQNQAHFHQMIACYDPPALLVLAYWAGILVRRAEQLGCWYLKGAADRIITQVRNSLSLSKPAALCLLDELGS